MSPGDLEETFIRGGVVVIIDVLRATSVLPCALASGAARVIPTDSPPNATALLATLDRESTLLCGERDGEKIEGFHLGNSPLEYVPEVVGGKTLIYCSTNGSRAMIRCQNVAEALLASFVNAGAVLERLAGMDRDIIVLCAGNHGRPSMEDTALGGLLVDGLLDADPALLPDDGALIARLVWQRWRGDVPRLLRSTSHGAYLASLGHEADLDFCSQVDLQPIVPLLRQGRIEPGVRRAQTAQAAR
jgi:2-phosphosulfolactate phosphatase